MKASFPCGVVHVRLDGEPVAIEAGEGEKAVLAIFWWKDMPLGSRLFTGGELPVPASAARLIGSDAAAAAVAARIETPPADLGAALDAMSIEIEQRAARVDETVSVVVCTRDRPEALARCLELLTRCDPPADEIVVVDNAPSTDAARTVSDRFPQVRYVLELVAGLSQARNTGIARSSGSIIAFTDDDVEVEPQWVERLKSGFEEADIGSVTGLVLPASLRTEAAFTFEMVFGGLGGSFLPRTFGKETFETSFGEAPPVWKIGAGASMAVRRSALDEIGMFDLRLGAGASGCSEDSELWYRLLAAGWRCRYEPAAVVHHDHRSSVSALQSQLRAYMRGHMVSLLIQFENHRHPANLIRAVTLPIWLSGVAGLHAFRPGIRRKLIGSELRGLAEGPIYWLRRRGKKAGGETR